MKLVICIIAILFAVPAFAGSLAETFDGLYIQGAASDPLLTTLITTDYSNTISLKDAQGKKYLWCALSYNGTGTCIVRLMNTSVKSSVPALPVAAGTTFSRVINKNSLYANNSGCKGTTFTSVGTSNSIIEIQ